uniref:Retrotransposon gag domain-containing protein n=1 Tax=Davidia involucrata TaxID=16924 RepID=A0A5B6ZBA8_DAVIN
MVMTWLWNSMEPYVVCNVQLLKTAKQIWGSLEEMYSQEHNVSRIYELFERLFNIQQGNRSLTEHYGTLKGLWEELMLYQPLSTNLEVQRQQREEFQVALFLSSLNSEYRVFKDQILASEKLPTAANAYSRLQRASLTCGASSSSTSTDSSALMSGEGFRGGFRGSSRGGGHRSNHSSGSSGRGGGRRSFRGGRGGRTGRGHRSEWKCTYCGGTGHTEDYCWDKWGRPAHANQATDDPSDTSVTQSPAIAVAPVASSSDFHGHLSSQLSQIIQHLSSISPHLPTSTATLANSGSQDEEGDWFGA